MEPQTLLEGPAPWDIGVRVQRCRWQAGLTLRQLAEQTRAHDQDNKGILPAQLSRIETGRATCDVRELYLLARALKVSQEDLLGSGDLPWEVTRREVWDLPSTPCEDPVHPVMSAAGLYRYVPLDTASVLSCMQPYVFHVSAYDVKELVLEAHEGEELLWVIRGELEFWAQQPHLPAIDPTRTLLTAGDSLQFSSRLPHAFRATGRDQFALAILVRAQAPVPAPHEIIVRSGERS